MTKEELLQKLSEIEWDDFECKAAQDKLPEDVWETVSAFSNTSKELETSEPRMVKSHDVTLDAEYVEWIAEVKHRYRSAQVKAAVKVNGEKLLFNWQMGRDLVQKKAEERWGAGAKE